MLEKELSQLSDQSLLELYKSIIPTASLLETFSKKIEGNNLDFTNLNRDDNQNKNESNYKNDKTILSYKRHVIEIKIFSLKILEEIDQRGLETSESFERISNEANYVEESAQFFESNNPPNLTSIPQGSDTLPYLTRNTKK